MKSTTLIIALLLIAAQGRASEKPVTAETLFELSSYQKEQLAETLTFILNSQNLYEDEVRNVQIDYDVIETLMQEGILSHDGTKYATICVGPGSQ